MALDRRSSLELRPGISNLGSSARARKTATVVGRVIVSRHCPLTSRSPGHQRAGCNTIEWSTAASGWLDNGRRVDTSGLPVEQKRYRTPGEGQRYDFLARRWAIIGMLVLSSV